MQGAMSSTDAIQLKCKARHPPGDEIYREGEVSVFEVDGRKNKVRPFTSSVQYSLLSALPPEYPCASDDQHGLSTNMKLINRYTANNSASSPKCFSSPKPSTTTSSRFYST